MANDRTPVDLDFWTARSVQLQAVTLICTPQGAAIIVGNTLEPGARQVVHRMIERARTELGGMYR